MTVHCFSEYEVNINDNVDCFWAFTRSCMTGVHR